MGGRAPSAATPRPDTPTKPSASSGALTPAEVRALPAMVNVEMTARAVGKSRRQFYTLIREGRLPVELEPVRIGEVTKFRYGDILRFLKLDA